MLLDDQSFEVLYTGSYLATAVLLSMTCLRLIHPPEVLIKVRQARERRDDELRNKRTPAKKRQAGARRRRVLVMVLSPSLLVLLLINKYITIPLVAALIPSGTSSFSQGVGKVGDDGGPPLTSLARFPALSFNHSPTNAHLPFIFSFVS